MENNTPEIEISFAPEGAEIVQTRNSFDTRAFQEFIQKNQDQLQYLMMPMAIAQSIAPSFAAFKEIGLPYVYHVKGIVTNAVIHEVRIITQIELEIMKFDSKVEYHPDLAAMVDIVGFAPALVLWDLADFREHSKVEGWENLPYQGKVSIVDFSHLLF